MVPQQWCVYSLTNIWGGGSAVSYTLDKLRILESWKTSAEGWVCNRTGSAASGCEYIYNIVVYLLSIC